MQRNVYSSIRRNFPLSIKSSIYSQSRNFTCTNLSLNQKKSLSDNDDKIPLTKEELLKNPYYWKDLPKDLILDLHRKNLENDKDERFDVDEARALLSIANDKEELEMLETVYTNRNSLESETILEDEEEDEELDLAEYEYMDDDVDVGDEYSTFAQESVREFRDQLKFNRIAAYEMPHLVKLRQDYLPPNENQIVNYRYTTYLGENHPAERKVVLSLKVSNLKLDELSNHKFKLLSGVRYDYITDIFKISCQKFIEPSQNASYLSDILDDLIKESKLNPQEFKDLPLDTRHIKSKVKKGNHSSNKNKFKFPKEWENPINPKDRKFDFETDEKDKFNKRQDSVFNLIV